MTIRQLRIILGALIKNKLRFDVGASKKKKAGLIALFVLAYAMIETVAIIMSVMMREAFSVVDGLKQNFYFLILLTSAAVVLIFGIVHLVSTLYLAKDTDFYSMLPVKPSAVFAAKTLFVYLFETAIVVAVALPVMIVYGALSKAGVSYYFISVLCLPIVPALPLALAAIFAVPVMFLARKLRNRNIVPIIFYCILFIGMIALYIVPMVSMSSITGVEEITEEQLASFVNTVKVIGNILYPYSALSAAAFNVDTFALGSGASTAVNLLIFIGISFALISLLLLLGKFMYSQSAKANNQTDNSRAKKSEYKRATRLKTLMKREYLLALRTPSTMFQCYFTLLFPIVFAVIFGVMFNGMSGMMDVGEASLMPYMLPLAYLLVLIMMPVLSNAAITSFSREGTGIEALKTMPIDARSLVHAKILSWSVIGVPVGAVSAVIVNAFMFDAVQLILAVFAFMAYPFIFISFGVLWDMSSPKLSWSDPIQAIKHNTHSTIGQFIGIGSGMFIIILYTVITRFVPIMPGSLTAMVWSCIYAEIVVFFIIDVILYKRIDVYYKKMTV